MSDSLPPLKGVATLDTAPFRKGVKDIQTDLRAIAELAKKVGTIKITADLSAGKDVQRAASAIRAAVEEIVPTDMQRRIDSMFGGFQLGSNRAQQSAAVFEAQAAALRARIDELDRAVRITRADFQAGFGEASPEEIQQLSQKMRELQRELEQVGQEAKENFGEYSREAQKVANANRLAQTTAAAARGEITRLGLASQVKLGASSALQQFGPQAMGAANGLFQFARASDSARIAQGLFQKTIQKTGSTSAEAAQVVAKLQDTLGVTQDAAQEGIRGLLRQGYTLQQAYTALEGAGASALAAGRSAAEGMQGYVDAVTSGTSAALNQIGISENLFPFYAQYAKSIGKTTDELTRQDKVQAELLLIQKATSDEVADLIALQSGLGGAVNSTNRELSEAQKQLGESLVPLAINGARALTRVLDVFNALPPGIQTTVALLGASAVAVGVLAAPVSTLVSGYKALWETVSKGRQAAKAVEAAADATQTLNTASKAGAFVNLLTWVKSAPAAWQMYRASVLAATGANNLWTASALRMIATNLGTWLTTTAAGAAAAAGVVAAAGGALAAATYKIAQDTQRAYADMDAADQQAFNSMMGRVRKLIAAGDELSRTRAKILLVMQQLAEAERGQLVGVRWTGERIYKRDEEAIARLRSRLGELREEEARLYTEQQRRAALAPKQVKLTDDQAKALQELRRELSQRGFELKVQGMTDLQRDLANLGREFDDLRRKVKQPFIVEGKLDLQNPELQQALRQLDAQLAAEQASVRKRYADEAVRTSRDSALAAQRAEIEAMRDGAAKKAALRQLELQDVQREVQEKIKSLSDFPSRQREVEAAGRRQIAALRQKWREEDRQLAEQNAQRVADAERAARDSVISAMRDGAQKEAALRAAALSDLRADIRRRVEELEGYPREQARVEAAGQQQISALRESWRQQDLRAAEEASRTLLEISNAARDAEIANIRDEGQRRAAARAAELSDLKRSLAERERALAAFPDAQRQAEELGRRQIAALRQKWAQEDEREARDRAARIAKAWASVADAQAQAMAAARGVEAAQLELSLSRRIAAVRGNALEMARIEAQAVQDRARLADQAAEAQWREDNRRLREGLRERLSAENLSADERRAIWAQYHADTASLDRRYQADSLKRLQDREEAERQAAERIRQARVQSALTPADDAGRDVAALQRQQQLAESTARQLALQVQVTAAREREAEAIASVLAQADQLQLTDEERRQLGDRLAQAQHEVTLSQREQIKLQDQITGEAEQLVNLYGQIVRLTGAETGVAAGQRELAEATRDLGDAYQRALPFLQQFREESLKPEDFTRAQEALGRLVTALEAQRQKLEQLRSEYQRQRDALQSVQDVLKGFGQEFGDESLLNNAISFNQATYDQAKNALDTLLRGGKYDAAQLAEATRNLQASYNGLKDSVTALGEARAREYERERDRIKNEAEAQQRVLDARIKAAKDAGLDTSLLEHQRDAIISDTERRVTALEGRAEAARKAAQDALSDRTKGLQQLLQGVQQGAATAGRQVDELGQQVQKSEKEVQDSAARIRKSLERAFKGVPTAAGKAGADAGKQFMAQLQKQLKAVKLPGITAPNTSTLPATRPAVTNISQVITINGQNVTGTASPNMKQLLKALQNEAEAECRRRNA
ncbi:hypothetical protein [Deinococcus geothermalis]|uniref:hypothetical protein n=1 Tax=Deinococcus geothermalis TaxID=68909 RepID=UPI0023559E6C|nr:hypothetical protein [Deinococcus geothermalis]